MTDNQYMSWCINNNIIIYVVPTGVNKYQIVVNEKQKKPNKGTKRYSINPTKKDELWWAKIYELYKFFYDKYN